MGTQENKDHYVEILLTFDADHFREIYNDQWKDEITLINRRHSDRLYMGRILVALLIFGFIMFFVHWLWATFIGIGTAFSVAYQLKMANEIQTLKQKLDAKRDEAENWLTDMEKASSFRLLLTPEHFTLFQDETPHKMRWENCRSFATHQNYVMIMGQAQESNFIFPRKSMKDADFLILTKTIEEKI